MLYFFRLLLFLININQESVLDWSQENLILTQTNFSTSINISSTESTTPILSIENLNSLTQSLWKHVQDGLTLADIENILFFILFVRFIILAIKYNLKTSFYITCIGLFAGYLWYRHLIDLISMYRSMLIKLPYLNKLGFDAIQLQSISRQMALTDVNLGENVHWYDPGQLIYYAFTKGILNIDSETGQRYYIDPISMFISNLSESEKEGILPLYYKIYNKIIPQVYNGVSKFWTQLSGIAAYAVITRIGKRYCPYLVRWHWTFLLIIGFLEQILIYFCYRVAYFQATVLVPQLELESGLNYDLQSVALQVSFLNGVITVIIFLHMGLIFFGLFHAVWGQYFYIPFFVENTELHIGPRPKNSIYSGGQTSWQDEKEENIQRVFPKLWFGWFGRGTKKKWNIFYGLQNLINKILRTLYQRFRN